MAKFALATTLLVLSILVSATPTSPKATFRKLTGSWSYEKIGDGQYTLHNYVYRNHGNAKATGSQTTQALSYDQEKKSISWKTEYNWDGNFVKSYAYIALENGIRKNVNSISEIPTSWSWKYDSVPNSLIADVPKLPIADVSYTLWLSSKPDSSPESPSRTTEVRIWLSNRGVKPTGLRVMDPPIIDIGGLKWGLYNGKGEHWHIFTFIATSQPKDYKGDLKLFLTYLSTSHKVGLNHYLVAVQAGTKPFQGMYTVASMIALVDHNHSYRSRYFDYYHLHCQDSRSGGFNLWFGFINIIKWLTVVAEAQRFKVQ
ncbi:glycoside hydrolase family 12 protein [Rhizoctonia solani 123E]|uniref:Glycoside hydrolase family 12 protein n=1 Tax=Rhizoctonia solani 123E TaxID=1423351 RepID=A0A074S4R4_9AGAM|nr:glycoside hydrolase family 12 protein [Rhizoctonia solani 123E]